ncbi:lipopolysaccharide assembly protein LapB [Emticicia sp. BO119]|uniref:tetratricopeptide repeat protein n=1 Tax=Emticicia sp. BO119 TaxID=2757768 RepID=UPI0015F04747|nr:tetratricopeptide repeat protein [Emticicia sp. BO119]MBA4849191.1 tetratricopeptide repeat protein [Emticicia sp. BO119]
MLSLVIPVNTFASDADFTPNLQKAYAEIFKLRIQTGRELIARERPGNPFKVYAENYADMVELLNSEDENAFESLTDKEDERLGIIEKTDKKSPYNRFLRAELKIHWALLKIRFGHEVKAAWNIIQAYRLLEENQRLFPEFLPNLKSIGCLHILVGSIPENQKWVTNFLGLKGNIQQGLKELELASQDKIWGLESSFCQFFIQAYILPYNDKVNELLMQAVEAHQDNLNLNFLATAISLKVGRTEQASQLILKSPYNGSYLYFPVFELYKGEINLFKGNYQQAGLAYLSYIQNFKGKAFLKDTYYKLFLCSWLAGDEKKGLTYISKIPTVGSTIAESDKAAQKFYENYHKTSTLPNKSLIKIRLYFDAGYYEKALNEARNLSENTLYIPKDKADLNYRLARVYHKTEQLDKAIAYYERAIFLTDKYKDAQWHFGASAALQTGYIYQERNQKLKAKAEFEKAISYKRHEYKTSIDNKARAALTAMGF